MNEVIGSISDIFGVDHPEQMKEVDAGKNEERPKISVERLFGRQGPGNKCDDNGYLKAVVQNGNPERQKNNGVGKDHFSPVGMALGSRFFVTQRSVDLVMIGLNPKKRILISVAKIGNPEACPIFPTITKRTRGGESA